MILDKELSKSVEGYWAISERVLLTKISARPFNIALIQVYSPTADAEEEEIDQFYEELDTAKKHCKSQEVVIIMGDLNAKVGRGRDEDTVGPHGLGIRNDRGERWIEWCKSNEQVIMNTWFELPKRRLHTWTNPAGTARNQIDYITVNSRFRNAVKRVQTYPGADCGSDHVMLAAKLIIKPRKQQQRSGIKRLDYTAFMKDEDMKQRYKSEVINRYKELQHVNGKTQWDTFKEALVDSAKEIIPVEERKKKQRWMTDEILARMEKRRVLKREDKEKYKAADKEIRERCKEAKERWLNDQCAKIEQSKDRDPTNLHRNIKELMGHKKAAQSGCIKAKNGEMLTEKKDLLLRWKEYTQELFQDDRGERPLIENANEGPSILKEEVESALKKMKNNKAAGPDEIRVELIKSLEEFGINKLTEILNEMYESGNLPDDLLKSVFITLPKKPGAVECEAYRTISLMSHVIKILLRILMTRLRSKLRPEISKAQCGFIPDSGTRNAIFMLRMLSERSIEMKRDLYVCFIDYTKAFDTVQHEELFRILQALNLDGKDVRIVRNLYWSQTAAVRVADETTEEFQIKRGVRQGCVLSPDLWNLYGERIMKQLEDIPGISVGGRNINNLRYADDTTMLAYMEEKLQVLMDKIVEESARAGLSLNSKKTLCMVITKKLVAPRCSLHAEGKSINQVEQFVYLGSLITADGRCDKDITRRIGMAKDAFRRMEKILLNRTISITTRLRVLSCYVIPVLTYGSEGWTISAAMERRIDAAEMWFLRRMLKVTWYSHTTNEDVLRRAGCEKSLLVTIRKRQLEFFGHVMRKEGLEELFITGKIEGRRDRGRQRLTYLDSMAKWTGVPKEELLHKSKDRDKWKFMIANVIGHGT